MPSVSNRKPNDPCLLCRTRLATKKNSHILPDFVTKTILGSDNRKIIYGIPSQASKIKKDQDTPKEDYILCPECETKLGVLEREFANYLYYPLVRRELHLFTRKLNPVDPSITIVIPRQRPGFLYHLFIWSIIWRASISSHSAFSAFNLGNDLEEELRSTLDLFIKPSTEMMENFYSFNRLAFPTYHTAVYLSPMQNSATSNFILGLTLNNDGDGWIVMNEFIIATQREWFNWKLSERTHRSDWGFGLKNSYFEMGELNKSGWDNLQQQIITAIAQGWKGADPSLFIR